MAHDRLIADIGGSSSRWAFCPVEGTVRTWPAEGGSLPGHNPTTGDGEAFKSAIAAHFGRHEPPALLVPEVIVYGAGCGATERQDRMAALLAPLFSNATVEVRSDLLGAARALYGQGPSGLVLILGTGLNAGYYDGTRLHHPMQSLGWLLGDEGSGVHIGRSLLREALYGRLPKDTLTRLFEPDELDLAAILQAIHGSPSPGRTMASYTTRMARALDDPTVAGLVIESYAEITAMLVNFFSAEERQRVAATGSVAWGFKELLGKSLAQGGMRLTAVERDPLAGLVRYHQRASSPR